MNSSIDKPRLIFAVAALVLIVLGAVCLFSSFPLGLLAIRAARAIENQASASPTALPAFTATSPAVATQPIFSSPTASRTAAALLPTIPPLQASATNTAPIPAAPTEPNATAPAALVDAWCVPWNSKSERALVSRVVDGVTFEVNLNGEKRLVRYIGIDLLEFQSEPEIWTEMTEKNRRLVEGKQVLLLEGLPKEEDGDLLRYVLVEGTFANLEMVQSGYAIASSMPPDTQCDPLFQEAQTEAILAERGLWGPEATPTRTLRPPTATISAYGPLVVVKVSQGTEWQEPDEFVEIYNSGTQPVQLEGWSISDSENHLFVFPNFVLGPVQYCRVYTDLYAPWHCGFSYYSPGPIWDDTIDCAYLKDRDGRLVDQFCYE